MSMAFQPWRVGLHIDYVEELLATSSGISMNNLARKEGFVSRGNFYVHFKKITGETPVEYKERFGWCSETYVSSLEKIRIF